MPIPGLIDTYAFADWMKVDYRKYGRPQLLVTPEEGGLLQVDFLPSPHRGKKHETTEITLELSHKRPDVCYLPGCWGECGKTSYKQKHDNEEKLAEAIALAEEMP